MESSAGARQGKTHRNLVPEPVLAKAGNEARVGQKGTLTRVWARKGTRPRAVCDTRYEWAYLFGAVPKRLSTQPLSTAPSGPLLSNPEPFSSRRNEER